MRLVSVDAGRLDYALALEVQKKLVDRKIRGEVDDVLLLLEHDNVITLGRRTSPENFKEQPIPVYQVERGGDATYHGPGQLVGYLIRRLEDQDVRRYLRRLEIVLLKTAKKFGVQATVKEGHTGVWVENGGKIASIGVAVNDWVTYHGFALNVDPDLRYFALIRPCGLNPEVLTSIRKVTGMAPSMQDVKKEVVEQIKGEFRYETIESIPLDRLLPIGIDRHSAQ
ncbi:MAG: lipoyl(octanoyl) transferase LipB [Nitrososphaerota archaeon]|jgi:lipoate-protein ligase B|nr:lipoyl(octanoyl) transferase LipB [Nitrososphaerota archaeon]